MQGEYVAPEKIENVYTRSSFAQQVYVDGDSLERYLIAIIVPEPSILKSWYQKEFGSDASMEQICKEPKVWLEI